MKSPVKVQMVGAVGGLDGQFAALLKPTLEGSRVDVSLVRTIPNAYTGVAVIIVDSSAGGENRIFFSPGANYEGMRPSKDLLYTALAAAPVPDMIVMQGEIPVETLVSILRAVGAQKKARAELGKNGIECGPDVLLNPAPAPPGGLPEDVYEGIDHLILNETEAELMSPPTEKLLTTVPETEGLEKKDRIARYFHTIGVTYVIITLGAKGVWYSAADAAARFTNQVPASKVSQVVDTTAAGDTFVGTYSVEVARWRERRRAAGKAGQDLSRDEKVERYRGMMDHTMGLATKAAARCVERHGAMGSIPFEDENEAGGR